ncbi:hypothetical protein [uncultured Shewanella sp.]|uniref:hypothetical protein n=1 Tax=uncultured Shewanella sp. TaxID=173975 RepID=UPI002621DBF5|nr:hypothetical protein [uncultured Shewanella sp.]
MKYLTAATLLLLPITSFAADYIIEVCEIQAMNDSNIAYIKPCENWVSKSNCDNGYIAWDMSKFQGQTMYSTALAALMANKKVRVRTNGSCSGVYDNTNMIRVQN